MLNLLKESAARKQAASRLYQALVARAREPVFFTAFGVADSVDGRFDLLVFHAWLVLAELGGRAPAQALIDTIFTGFDEALREQGAGDIAIGHRLKAMAKAFYGRIGAYDAAKSEEELAAALAKNLWRGADPDDAQARALAAYAASARKHLAAGPAGHVGFWAASHYLEPMTEGLPLSHSYNLARLGNAGDRVEFAADDDQRAAIASWSDVVAVDRLEVRVEIRKLSASRFGLNFHLTADVSQACVVTLEPVKSHLEHKFDRELHFVGGSIRHKAPESGPELVLDVGLEEGPEEIHSLHYDLAVPVLEEYNLALEPYPRCPGVEFAPPSDPEDRPQSPFTGPQEPEIAALTLTCPSGL